MYVAASLHAIVRLTLSCRISRAAGQSSARAPLEMCTRVSGGTVTPAIRIQTPVVGSYLGIDVAIKEVLPSTEYDVSKYFEREWRLLKCV
jgi:hypothetical protein